MEEDSGLLEALASHHQGRLIENTDSMTINLVPLLTAWVVGVAGGGLQPRLTSPLTSLVLQPRPWSPPTWWAARPASPRCSRPRCRAEPRARTQPPPRRTMLSPVKCLDLQLTAFSNCQSLNSLREAGTMPWYAVCRSLWSVKERP